MSEDTPHGPADPVDPGTDPSTDREATPDAGAGPASGWTPARRPQPAPPVRPRPRDDSAAAPPVEQVPADEVPVAEVPAAEVPAADPPPADAPPPDAPAPEVAAATAGPARGTLALAGALVLVLAVAAVVLVLQVRNNSATEAAREAALTQGPEATKLLLSYDYRQLDEDFAQAQAVTTGEFTEEYKKQTETIVKDAATQTKAVVKTEVVDAAVTSASPDQVSLLVYLTQTTTKAGENLPQVAPARVQLTLVDKDGMWLVSKVDAL